MFLNGILQALGCAIISGFFFVYIRTAVSLYDVSPIPFTVMSMLGAALSLSLAAGPGKYVGSTLKGWQTWFYGFLLIGTYILDMLLVNYVSGTEAGLLNRLTIPASLLLAFFIFKRKPTKEALIGNSIILLGFAVLIINQGFSLWQDIWLIVLLVVLFNAGTFITAEAHKQYAIAHENGSLRDKMRVVAFVSFLTALLFMLISFGTSFIKEQLQLSSPFLEFIPLTSSYVHAPSLISGVIFGMFFASLNRYLTWSAARNLKSENVLAVMALVPWFSFGWEWLLSYFIPSIQPTSMPTGVLFVSVVLISGGALLAVLLHISTNMKNSEHSNFWSALKSTWKWKALNTIQHSSNAEDDYEIICATLEHARGNQKKAAQLLNIPYDALQVLYNAKGSLALVPSSSQSVSRRYRKYVASCDALTGIFNRSGFMAEAKKVLCNVKSAHILFIDLDKFKPVNDTYGHEIGDKVLQGVATRLNEILPNDCVIARIGGDEFCVLVPNITVSASAKILAKIQQSVAKQFKFQDIEKPINISASIGASVYPDDSKDIEYLLNVADSNMYRKKSSR